MESTIKQTEFFKGVGQIKYEGTSSDNPFAYRWYDENKMVAGKSMKDHLRFACAYWHSFNGSGADPFGEPTHLFEWDKKSDAIERAKDKADAAFEFITKLGLPYYCFHDLDVIDYTNDVKENDRRLKAITDYLSEKQKETGVKLLWGTANLFSNRRYMNGAATNPDFHVLSHAAAQVKAALDATIAMHEGAGHRRLTVDPCVKSRRPCVLRESAQVLPSGPPSYRLSVVATSTNTQTGDVNVARIISLRSRFIRRIPS